MRDKGSERVLYAGRCLVVLWCSALFVCVETQVTAGDEKNRLQTDSTGSRFPLAAWKDVTFGEDGVGSFRKHSFCDRWRQVNNKSFALRDGLRNQNLSSIWPQVEGYEIRGLHNIDESGALTDKGLMIEIFDEISRRAGFNWRNSYAFFDLPGETPEMMNTTWSDVMHWTAQNYDVSVGWYPELTVYKSEGMLFPEAWFDASLVLITKSQKQTEGYASQLFSFTQPFSTELWIALIISWFSAQTLYHTHIQAPARSPTRSPTRSPSICRCHC